MSQPASDFPVYDRALDAIADVEQFVRRIPPERRDLRDQLRRASVSIVLNLAEGASEFRPREKARFYPIARRSAAECLAALDVVERVVEIQLPEASHREQLGQVAREINKLVHSTERRSVLDRT